ncbi:MAG: hypothetical protein LBO74_10715 [Candidatus Symbiothrix sp.]|nr:hypothetical protein [Candidatus Symbiothrix sp.]
MSHQEMLNENGGGAISDFICTAVKIDCALVIIATETVKEVAKGVSIFANFASF